MKSTWIPALLALALTGCGANNIFCEASARDNKRPIVRALLGEGENRLMLTDYLPVWDGADSVTSSRLKVKALARDWSEFGVEAPKGASASTFEVWSGGHSLSVAALSGKRAAGCWAMSGAAEQDLVEILTSVTPRDIVALWQNCRLPQDYIRRTERGVELRIPRDARDEERSVLRVFMAGDEGLFNDLLIPLERGRVVTDPASLNRHDHEAQVLYSLMIDRFSNGNPANDAPLNRKDVLPQVDYQGGDVKGITQKIEEGFFDDLGISTIWISPITQNPRDAWGYNQTPETRFSGYHGYWPIYTTVTDDRFATPDELREMLSVAHSHGINVILDYVANHLHINSPVLKAHPDWVTPLMLPDGRKNLGLWDEQRLTTWFDEHIPSLDLAREEVCRPMTDSALYWVREYEFDGFRHDACKHIPLNYWRMLTRKMRQQVGDRDLWQIGETYGSPELISSYVCSGMIDAQFDFNVYHTALDVLTRGRSIRDLARVVEESSEVYGAHHTMGNITGNHDKARLISLAGGQLSPDEDHKAAGWLRKIGVGDPVGYKKLALINALNMTIPGVPCIYQGDEYGEPGGNDPDNRRMMRFEGYSELETTQRMLTQQLIGLRRGVMPLIYGDMVTLSLSDDVWVFLRAYMGEYAVVALNVSDREQTVECDLPALVDPGQQLTAHFGQEFKLENGHLTLHLAPTEFEVLTK